MVVEAKKEMKNLDHPTREDFERAIEIFAREHKQSPTYPVNEDEHDALCDARFNRDLHQYIKML